MDWLLYFTSFSAVLVLFASAVAIVGFVLKKMGRDVARLFAPKAKRRSKAAAPRGKFDEDYSNPNYFKRAGQ
jgi:hypothetical protein